MKTRTKTLLAALTTAALVGSANAAVISISQQTAVQKGGGPSGTFSVTDSDSVLALLVYRDGGSAMTDAIFAGASATETIDNGRVSVAYWLNPSTVANSSYSAVTSGAPDTLYYLVELAGVDQTAAVTVSTVDSIATTVADEFILSAAGRNSSDSPFVAPTNTSDIDTPLDISVTTLSDFGDSGGGQIAAGSTQAPTAATYDVSWDNDSDGRVALAFKPVPEPGSLALLGLGGLLIGARRRRGS